MSRVRKTIRPIKTDKVHCFANFYRWKTKTYMEYAGHSWQKSAAYCILWKLIKKNIVRDLLRKIETKIPTLALESFNEFLVYEGKDMSADFFLKRCKNCRSSVKMKIRTNSDSEQKPIKLQTFSWVNYSSNKSKLASFIFDKLALLRRRAACRKGQL